ncbi:MFS transporter [Actinokineospora xionganensis]|uniref:MFS transporter n=1 Tax=Actinokineospora xionganensis TaxID=2684470 RepID=A0ABR7L6V1_9PSEU|nr:MFS transporter [Actinokineospora xionganensis]MBC6448101.1 MFS transporter [Actinokineospora xionganensis]
MTTTTEGLGRFVAIWVGQLVSLAGTAVTGFVLGVWVYQLTGSATQFSLIMLVEAIAAISVAPLAGAVADRVDRRWTLVASDVVAAAVTAVLLTLVTAGGLQVWQVYPISAVAAMCATFRMVTFTTMLPLLVPEQHLSRANGLAQAGMAVQISAPLAAGVLLATVGLRGVVLIDLFTYGVALAITVSLALPERAVRPQPREHAERDGAMAELRGGWTELRRRSGLGTLLLVLGAFDFAFGLAGVLVQPLILTFAGPSTLGVLMFAGGGGMLLGSAVMSVWGGPKRRITGVSAFLAIGGVALALHSLAPSALLIGILAPAFLFTLPVITGCTMSLLQTKVDPSTLGRVMASVRMVSQGATAIAYAVAGPLADQVFEPMLAPGGALADSVGGVIGTGPGRGIALIFVITGAVLLVLAAAMASPRLRAVDGLPDLLHTKGESDVELAAG